MLKFYIYDLLHISLVIFYTYLMLIFDVEFILIIFMHIAGKYNTYHLLIFYAYHLLNKSLVMLYTVHVIPDFDFFIACSFYAEILYSNKHPKGVVINVSRK